MLKKILILIVAVTLILVYKNYSQPQQEEHVHHHAGFRVYIDGVLQDYSDAKYMNFTPCSEHEAKLTKEQEQMELAHLHDFVGDVVHTHRLGSKWGDLFENSNIDLPKDKALKGYINGIENEDIMDTPIKEYTTAIFVVGNNEAGRGQEMISVDYIKEVEGKSELCGVN